MGELHRRYAGGAACGVGIVSVRGSRVVEVRKWNWHTLGIYHRSLKSDVFELCEVGSPASGWVAGALLRLCCGRTAEVAAPRFGTPQIG